MPGICGIVNHAGAADCSVKLAEMLNRTKHFPWYVENRYVNASVGLALGRVSLGFVNTDEQPAFNEDRSLLAVMEGEIYDYEEHRRALEAGGHRFKGQSHAELLLHGYESGQKTFFRGLHGSFAAAIWDVQDQRLVIVNDRFGMKPLYYAKLPGRLMVASEIKSLLVDPEVSRKRNLRGIAQFFTFGHFLNEDTFLESVRLLPPAGWLAYDSCPERLTLDRYWRLGAGSTLNSMRESELLDRLDECFKRAVDRCVGRTRRLGISLSGGLDSRTILAAIDHEQVPVTSLTMGMEGSVDHRIAQQLSALSNRRHHGFLLNQQFLSQFGQHLRNMVHLTDGHYLSQCIVMPTLPAYRELGIEVLIRGHAGELLHMEKAYAFSIDQEGLAIQNEAGLTDWLLRHLRTYVSLPASGSLFVSPLAGQMEPLAIDSLRGCLRESEGLYPEVQRVWHLFVTQRLRRETAMSMVKFGSLMETRLPYLDNELVDAIMSAPPELKLRDKIQCHILRRRRPEFLHVVNSNTWTVPGAGYMARLAGTTGLKVLAKLRVPGYQPYERLGLWLRRELRPLVHELLLDERCLDRGVFDAETVKKVVEDHWTRKKNYTFLLMAMMIFELGQREFMAEEEPPRVVFPASNGRRGKPILLSHEQQHPAR